MEAGRLRLYNGETIPLNEWDEWYREQQRTTKEDVRDVLSALREKQQENGETGTADD